MIQLLTLVVFLTSIPSFALIEDNEVLENYLGRDPRYYSADPYSGRVRTTRNYRSESRARGLLEDEKSAFDDVRIHTGVAMINSLQTLSIFENTNPVQAGVRGIQLNLGIDLFSPNWIAEGSILNFPEMRQEGYWVASNAFELKLYYTGAIAHGLTLHGGPGVSSRNFSIRADGRNGKSAFEKSIATANSVFAFGASYWVSGYLSLGVEATARMALVSVNDPQSIDLGIRLDGHF